MNRRRFLALLPALPAAIAAAVAGSPDQYVVNRDSLAATVTFRGSGPGATLTAPRCYPAGIIAEVVDPDSPVGGGRRSVGKLAPDARAAAAELAAINDELERSYDVLARLGLAE